MVFLFVLITFEPIWTIFLGFGQIQQSKMAVHNDRHSEIITQFLPHLASSPHNADVKGDIFRRTNYPPSLVVTAFVFSELWRLVS